MRGFPDTVQIGYPEVGRGPDSMSAHPVDHSGDEARGHQLTYSTAQSRVGRFIAMRALIFARCI